MPITAVILAGGLGTRISEETHLKPKPMIEIGGKPIIWHIMKIYSHHGINDFIICCGYKGYLIKEYFFNYQMHNSDLDIDMKNKEIKFLTSNTEQWSVKLVDTGLNTATGGRLKKIKPYLDPTNPFCFTYGDGLSNINIKKLIEFHKSHNKLATISSVFPPSRFGLITHKDDNVISFSEKPTGDMNTINGGFFVLSPKVLNYIKDDNTSWESEPLKNLAKEGELKMYKHNGFWQCMDTLRDKVFLENLWNDSKPPWKVWS